MKVRRLFHDEAEVEAVQKNNAPDGAMDLPLEVVPLPMVGCFSGSCVFGGFLRKRLVGEKSEY